MTSPSENHTIPSESPAAKPFLAVRDLRKGFAGVAVLKGVSFTLQRPQVVALLGLNGAGKSTLMRLIAGFLPADGGDVEIGDVSLTRDPEGARKELGYLPENAPSHPGFRVEEALHFTAEAQGLRGKALMSAVESVMKDCALTEVRTRMTDQLSKGFRHRLGLAQALIHRPKVLMLDEPTDGLDPAQKTSARALLKELGSRHVVLVSTHLLEEVSLICDRVLILKDGVISYDGPVPSKLVL